MDRIRRTWNSRYSRRGTFYFSVIASAVIAVLLLIVVVTLVVSSRGKDAGPDRIECPGLTKHNCTRLMCLYDEVNRGPSCYMKKDSFGYVVRRVDDWGNRSLTIQMDRVSRQTPYGQSIPKVTFTLTYLTEHILRFQLKDTENERYEVPIQKDFSLLKDVSSALGPNLSYEVVHSNESDVFFFGVKRTSDGTLLWDTRIGGLLMSDQYLQIASYLPSSNVYGLGEHVHSTFKHDMNYVSWPMFARDRVATVKESGGNLYGVHPFYTCLENSGKSHGVLFLNSNAMEATLLPSPAISYRTIGGILDFFVFVGDSPEHVIQLYTSLIGRPMLPPYWSLGFQLSRYGYNNLSNVEAAMNRTREAKVPQAVQYLDIDYMQQNMDFTWNKEMFPDLPKFINDMKKDRGLKLIVILDPGIAAEDKYEPYERGLQQSVFIKRSPAWKPSMFPPGLEDANITFGKVWPPRYVAFPDFLTDKTKQWWKDLIIKYRNSISFDGLWIDMNEPANFGTNEEYAWNCKKNESKENCLTLKCPNSNYEDPPYNPLLSTGSDRISAKTLCMESIQGDGNETYLHYDVHSLYGWSQTQPTLEAAQTATATRSLIISRSTYPSSGRHCGHWLGDNESTWEDMKRSVIGILEFNLFGMPYVGADVCGFFGNTTVELCKRWMQLGAFYPFYRNHNGIDSKDQDPGILGEEVSKASRKAVERRLKLNPYLYTLLYRAHVDGNTVVRPVFHEYPHDEKAWDIDTQFMWGKSLMITPILEEGSTTVSSYLPNDEWWLFDSEKSRQELLKNDRVIETAADEYTPLHVRGGVVLPCGNYTTGKSYPENFTQEISLYVFPKDGEASGELFVDDGLSIDTVKKEEYALFKFTYRNCTLTITEDKREKFRGGTPVLEAVVVFKVKDIASAYRGSIQYNFTMLKEFNSVVIGVKQDMDKVAEIKWKASDSSCGMLM